MVVEEAYKAKAKKVTVEWDYQPLAKLHVRYQSVKTMGTVTDFQKARTIRSNCKLHFSFHLVLAVLHDIFPQYKPTKQGL